MFPTEMIDVEVPLSYYEKGKKSRMDIIVSEYHPLDKTKMPMILTNSEITQVFH